MRQRLFNDADNLDALLMKRQNLGARGLRGGGGDGGAGAGAAGGGASGVDAERLLFESRWFCLRQEDLLLPGGESITTVPFSGRYSYAPWPSFSIKVLSIKKSEIFPPLNLIFFRSKIILSMMTFRFNLSTILLVIIEWC